MSLLEMKLRELFLKISTEPFWESSQSTVFVCPSYTFAFKSCSHARPTKSSGQNARNGFDGNCKNGCWKWTSNVHRNNADRCSFATGLFFLNFCVYLNVVMQDLLNELSFQKILTFSLAKLFNFKSRTTFSFTDQVISLSQSCTTDIPLPVTLTSPGTEHWYPTMCPWGGISLSWRHTFPRSSIPYLPHEVIGS